MFAAIDNETADLDPNDPRLMYRRTTRLRSMAELDLPQGPDAFSTIKNSTQPGGRKYSEILRAPNMNINQGHLSNSCIEESQME
ncbi:hypothetical protein Ciccas_002406 [Cichlidogyrus casuarinus]|uniref:Uncharacterized protein n=1 Tax=Cichlidogyrus casuarinus TaxID=1844966 RepID=A0ABD2QKI7_9PLAT